MRKIESLFGNCSRCGERLHPVWFEDIETRNAGGYFVPTGRKRIACSHLECDCGKKECVDDTFDGAWYKA